MIDDICWFIFFWITSHFTGICGYLMNARVPAKLSWGTGIYLTRAKTQGIVTDMCKNLGMNGISCKNCCERKNKLDITFSMHTLQLLCYLMHMQVILFNHIINRLNETWGTKWTIGHCVDVSRSSFWLPLTHWPLGNFNKILDMYFSNRF